MTTYELNKQYDGIEITFDERPIAPIRTALKNNGFRWHHMKKMWYAKKTDTRLALAMLLTGAFDDMLNNPQPIEDNKIDDDLCGDGTPLADVGKEIFEQAKEKSAAVSEISATAAVSETSAAVEEISAEKIYKPARVTSKTIEAARKRLLKLAMGCASKAMHGLTPIENGFYLIHDHFIMEIKNEIPGAVIVSEENRISESFISRVPGYFKKDFIEVNRPNENELKDFIAADKLKAKTWDNKKTPYFLSGDELDELGFDVAVNPKYLLDMLQALPYGKVYVNYDNPHEIYVIQDDGERGMILPIKANRPRNN